MVRLVLLPELMVRRIQALAILIHQVQAPRPRQEVFLIQDQDQSTRQVLRLLQRQEAYRTQDQVRLILMGPAQDLAQEE